MDTSDKDIIFDSNGVCNHCNRYTSLVAIRTHQGEDKKNKLDEIIEKIKIKGRNKDYDCIVGVSGGVDSTYVAYLTKKLGLRPLAIHFDNGWNSELAVSNIERVLNKLDIELYTYVIDWEEFKKLQLAFLYASTPDGEVPTDHAINALLFMEASKRNIKYIINGMNFATESLAVKSWAYGHSDWKYIRSVNKIFNKKRLVHYPHFNFLNLFYWTFIKRISSISILNYIDYNKEEVMQVLQNELEWVYYGGKHYESVYTRFYQGYILPEKFNIDKRRGHLSDLINSGQLSRDKALDDIKKPAYDPKLLRQDFPFVHKKFELSENEFEKIMKMEIKTYNGYPNNEKYVMILKRFVNYLRKKGYYSK